MKQCTYCGKQYSADSTVCDIDGQPLVPFEPRFAGKSSALHGPSDRGPNEPEGDGQLLKTPGWEKMYWQCWSIFCRSIGAMFVIGGLIFCFWGLSLLLTPQATVDVNGVPSSDPWVKANVLAAGLVVVVVGVCAYMARSYRPKE